LVIVRTGSGNFQGWYRHNGEKRVIRPEPDKPIDILGGGFIVAPPSQATRSEYRFIAGGLHDLDHLPHLHDPPPNGNEQARTAAPQDAERIREGRRNTNLWKNCMRAAHHCDDFDALLDVARTRNTEFLQPLEDGEVVKAARSAWGYTERGDNRFGRPGVFFDADTVNDLIGNDQDLFVLLSFLHANNGPDREFMATNQGLAKRLNWTVKRVAAARRRMIDDGYAEQTRPAYTKQPALYRWIKG
jgi:hypothetical protein